MNKDSHESAKKVEMNNEGFPTHLMEAINKDIKVRVAEVARKYQLTESEVEELQAEVRCKVISSFPNYKAERSSFQTFARNIATNFLTNWKVREYNRRKHIVPMTAEYELLLENMESDDEAKAQNAERANAVRYAVSRLNKQERRVCELYLRYGSLEKVRQVVGQSSRRFYTATWPNTRKNFLRFYEEA